MWTENVPVNSYQLCQCLHYKFILPWKITGENVVRQSLAKYSAIASIEKLTSFISQAYVMPPCFHDFSHIVSCIFLVSMSAFSL